MNTPKFSVDRYVAGRPLYPRRIFRSLENLSLADPTFLDLACGTGYSTRSFLDLEISRRGFAIDPDSAMLAAARDVLSEKFPEVVLREGSAETIPLETGSVDLVLVGSAIHWFDLSRARSEIARVSRANGVLFIFEYQFPKCIDRPELAETIRRRFNLEWKAPVQRPRGSLAELALPFHESGEWVRLGDDRPEWRPVLSHDEFLGHLFSQSRYLHAEAEAPDPASYRASVADSLAPYFQDGPLRFDLKPRAILLQKAPASPPETRLY
jgi:SAM-dependent methyltransferase